MPFVGSAYNFSGVETDPYWGSVLVLLNGSGTVTTESSSYARTLTTNGSPTLDSGNQLFSLPTYKLRDQTVGASDRVQLSDTFVAGEFAADEWTIECWLYVDGCTNTTYFSNFGATTSLNVNTDGSITGGAGNIGGGAYTATSSAASLSFNAWHHVALVRDHSDATFGYLKVYIDGVYQAASNSFSKSSSTSGNSSGWIFGTGNVGVSVHITQYRMTKTHCRYYSNFTPPSASFPTS